MQRLVVDPINRGHMPAGGRTESSELVVTERCAMRGVAQVGGRVVRVRRAQEERSARSRTLEERAEPRLQHFERQMFGRLESKDEIVAAGDLG